MTGYVPAATQISKTLPSKDTMMIDTIIFEGDCMQVSQKITLRILLIKK